MNRRRALRAIAALEARHQTLLDLVRALDESVIRRRPASGAWSILEILDHLVASERAILGGLKSPEALTPRVPRPAQHARRWLVFFILRFRIPVRVPAPAMLPRGMADLVELRRAWDENLAWLRSYAASQDAAGLRRAVFFHPVAGPLTLAQALRMGRLHLGIHTTQIHRILAAQP